MWENGSESENAIRENETMRPSNSYLSAACAFVLVSPGFAIAQQTCESLKDLKLDHATVVTAAAQEPAPLKMPPGTPFKVSDFTVPRHCEVTAIARPTSDSEIDFTLWLPPKDV